MLERWGGGGRLLRKVRAFGLSLTGVVSTFGVSGLAILADFIGREASKRETGYGQRLQWMWALMIV